MQLCTVRKNHGVSISSICIYHVSIYTLDVGNRNPDFRIRPTKQTTPGTLRRSWRTPEIPHILKQLCGWIVLTKFCEEAQEDEGEMDWCGRRFLRLACKFLFLSTPLPNGKAENPKSSQVQWSHQSTCWRPWNGDSWSGWQPKDPNTKRDATKTKGHQ